MIEPPVPLAAHAPRRFLADAEHAVEIDVQHAAPVLLAHLQEVGARRHAGIVDQDRDRPQRRLRRIESACDRGAVGDVEGHGAGLAAGCPDLGLRAAAGDRGGAPPERPWRRRLPAPRAKCARGPRRLRSPAPSCRAVKSYSRSSPVPELPRAMLHEPLAMRQSAEGCGSQLAEFQGRSAPESRSVTLPYGLTLPWHCHLVRAR